MRVFRDMQCQSCSLVVEDFQERDSATVLELFCPSCDGQRTFERVLISAPGIAFGMISGAVSGSGFHNTDYGKANSDLVNKRAIDHAYRNHGVEVKPKQR